MTLLLRLACLIARRHGLAVCRPFVVHQRKCLHQFGVVRAWTEIKWVPVKATEPEANQVREQVKASKP